MKYYAACARDDKALERLIEIQQWGSYECSPAHRITILIQNMSALPRQFRGILWADIVDIY